MLPGDELLLLQLPDSILSAAVEAPGRTSASAGAPPAHLCCLVSLGAPQALLLFYRISRIRDTLHSLTPHTRGPEGD